jgi:hypothetical protein
MRPSWLLAVGTLTVVGAASLVGPAHGHASRAVVVATSTAPDEVTALAMASAQGSRVEALNRRTQTGQLFANPDGTYSEETFLEPVRVQQPDRSWVDVDTTLKAGAGGRVVPVASAIGLSFSGGGDSVAVTISQQDRVLSLGWSAALPVPALTGDTATYREVLPGVDLRLRALARGFVEQLIVKTAAAAASPALASIGFTVQSRGLTLRTVAGGGLAAVDPAGATVFSAPAPAMWDSAGTRAADADQELPATGERAVSAQVAAGQLILVPDRSLLTSPTAVYPLVIDPTFTYGSPSWTEVNKYDPDSATWRTPSGTLAAGFQDFQPATLVRSFLRFGLDSRIWSTHILSADLSLYENWAATHACAASAVEVWVTGGFNSSTTWNHQPTWGGRLASTTEARGNTQSSCGPDWVDFVVTSGVAGAARNHTGITFGLKAANESDAVAWRKYAASGSFAPKLTVKYNHKPTTPAASTMSTSNPGSGCATSAASATHVNILRANGIRLTVKGSDPDRDKLSGSFELWDNTGSSALVKASTGQLGPDPKGVSTLSVDVLKNVALQAGHVYKWRASLTDYDGASHAMDTTPLSAYCYLLYDPVIPNPPVVMSTDYPTDQYAGGGGRPGTFLFAPGAATDTDVTTYTYWLDAGAHTAVPASATGHNASGSATPASYGPHDLHVVASDAAGNPSSETLYHFYVDAPNDIAGHWAADEASGTSAGSEPSPDPSAAQAAPLTMASGTCWASGGHTGGGLHLNGATGGEAVTAGPVVDSAKSFTVAAWVRLCAKGHAMDAVAGSGSAASGFFLQYLASTDRWTFDMPQADVNGSAETWVSALNAPAVGVWTHLAGVYDAVSNQLSLYVDGVKQGSQTRVGSWNASGPLRVGDVLWNGSPRNYLDGDVDDVLAYGRALSETDIAGLTAGTRPEQVTAAWGFDEGAGTVAAGSPGPQLALQSGASWSATGKLDSGLHFDGYISVAKTTGPLVDTSRDFTACAWARIGTKAAALGVVSQAGTRTSGFHVIYNHLQDRWMFGMARADADGQLADFMLSTSAPAIGQWAHLCGVYQAGKLTLYVNGTAQGSPVPHSTPWNATGPVTVGGVWWNGATVNYSTGDIDEVRLYTRALYGGEIADIYNHDAAASPAGQWHLENGNDTSGRNHPLTLTGTDPNGAPTASYVPGGHLGGGLSLTGTAGAARTSTPVLRTDQSFAVAAWVKLDAMDAGYTVLSQDGVNDAGFVLRYIPPPVPPDPILGGSLGQWQFAIDGADTENSVPLAPAMAAAGEDPTVGWVHLTARYDAFTHKLALRVRDPLGTRIGYGDRAVPWNAGGPLQLGRDRVESDDPAGSDPYADYLAGTVDEVNVFAGVPSETDIRRLIANS